MPKVEAGRGRRPPPPMAQAQALTAADGLSEAQIEAAFLAAVGMLDAALVDRDFLISTKEALIANQGEDAKGFYVAALAGAALLRDLFGVDPRRTGWTPVEWEDIP